MTTGAELINGDSNGDGDVDADDLVVWQTQYGEPGHSAVAIAVPEPHAATIVMVAMVGLALKRRAN